MPKVTLTFDNGPEPEVTPHVLDCLARRHVKATFFLLGRKVETPVGRRLAERALAEGHWIGNHTFSHATPLGLLDESAAIAEFEKAERAIARLGGPSRLFRPYGRAGSIGPHLLHPAVVERLCAGRYSCVLWNSVPGDWRDPEGWCARAVADCQSRDWSLVVLHDLPTGAMRHLDRFLGVIESMAVPVVQDYPPECVPIRDGEIVLPMEEYVAARQVAD